ncbi:MAG: extracellular solute-binding protein [Planctomycetes bacterium]|nr:extracellular solute-binding protein [Planctomycetota bacterium]
MIHKQLMRTNIVLIILILAVATIIALIPPRAVMTPGNELKMATWGMPFEDLLFRDVYARGFEKENPGWSIHYQRHGHLVEKYNAWHVQRRGADVMRMGIDYYKSFVAKGMLAPLTEYLNDPEIGLSEEEIKDYFPAIWEQLLIDGEIYALPSDNSQYGLYYNKTIFDQYNEAHPDEPLDYPGQHWTWDDLADATQRLTVRNTEGQDRRITQYGILFDLWAWPYFAFLKQAGGNMWDEAQTTTLINSEAGVEALTYLVSLVPPDAPMRSPDQAASAASPVELFKTGHLAMLLDGSWQAPSIERDKPGLNFAIAPCHAGNSRASSAVRSSGRSAPHSHHPHCLGDGQVDHEP